VQIVWKIGNGSGISRRLLGEKLPAENRKEQKIVHLEALCEMMEELTGDTRFTEQIEKFFGKRTEGGKHYDV